MIYATLSEIVEKGSEITFEERNESCKFRILNLSNSSELNFIICATMLEIVGTFGKMKKGPRRCSLFRKDGARLATASCCESEKSGSRMCGRTKSREQE